MNFWLSEILFSNCNALPYMVRFSLSRAYLYYHFHVAAVSIHPVNPTNIIKMQPHVALLRKICRLVILLGCGYDPPRKANQKTQTLVPDSMKNKVCVAP